MKLKMIAAVLGLALAGAANAAITNSQGGNGELFFTLWDTGATSDAADDRAYVLDLGSLLSGGGNIRDWVSAVTNPQATLSANKQVAGTVYSLAPDANLVSFLAASSDLSRLQWNIAALDSNGTDSILTTAAAIPAGNVPKQNGLRAFNSNGDVYVTAMNSALTGTSALYEGSAAGVSKWGSSAANAVSFDNAAGIGESQNFFVVSEKATTGTTALTTVQQFQTAGGVAMTWTLQNDGTLVYAAPVPEPETYALFLAGLGMLGAIARRRLAK